MKVVLVTVRPVIVSGVPSLDSCASTINNERSASIIISPITTEQITVILDPRRTGLGGILVTVMEDGAGTGGEERIGEKEREKEREREVITNVIINRDEKKVPFITIVIVCISISSPAVTLHV